MRLHEQAWWPDFVAALRDRPLVSVAPIYGLDPYQALEALVAADDRGAAQDQPWWPEAERIVEQFSIRQAAKTFQTSPRRIRRALARLAKRVGGQDLDDGVPQLAPLRERLGQEPDHVLAEEAGVPVEAVQGERRRLDVPAFHPEPAAAPAPTASSEADDLPPAADDLPPAADERPVGSSRDEVRVVRRPARSGKRIVKRVRRWSPPSVAERERPAARRPEGVASLEAPPSADRTSASEAREDGEGRRRGRTKIIRREPIARGAEAEETPVRKRKVIRRHKGKGPHGVVRELRPSDVDLSDVIADASETAPAPVVHSPEREAAEPGAAVSQVTPSQVTRSQVTRSQVTPSQVTPSPAPRAEEAPVAARLAAAAVGHLPPTADADEAYASGPQAETDPLEVEAPAAEAETEAETDPLEVEAPEVEAPEVEAPEVEVPADESAAEELAADALPAEEEPAPRYGWLLEIDGVTASPLILATDALEAAEQIARWSGGRAPGRASLKRVGLQLLPGGR